jgi:hypothetical protein
VTADRQALINEVREILSRRYGFDSMGDVRPAELARIITADARAIVKWHLAKAEGL